MLDSRFIVTSDLEEYFVDKDTGLPLAAGIVTFYSDIDRNTKKPVYQLTGSPPNYSYAVLPNPCILSAVGTFQDALGNNIVPYYFPYEGTPADSDGTIELYYITVESSGLVPQFTREAWPNFSQGDEPGAGAELRNFIPNGQFLTHTDIIGSTQPPIEHFAGLPWDIQPIAQGGWSFNRSTGGSSTFNNSFSRITTAIGGLNDFPRYAFNYNCTSFLNNDIVRDIAIRWPDVNKFSAGNPEGTQEYTLFCAAESNDSNTYTFDIRLIYYYGSGGSPTAFSDVSIGTFSIGPSYGYKRLINVVFPSNGGTLGTNDDDFVMISLRGPTSPANVQVTDFALVQGSVLIDIFPEQTNAEMLSESIAGWVPTPNPDGSDLYLVPRLTPTGMIWDRAEVGRVEALIYNFSGSTSPDTNLIKADGSSYLRTGYSPLGIPYYRLAERLFAGNTVTPPLPMYGTGLEFVNTYNLDISNYLNVNTNQPGPQASLVTDITAGVTVTSISTGIVTSIDAYVQPAGIVCIGNTIGAAFSIVNAGTSGFTVTEYRNNASIEQVFTVVPVAAAGLAGTYFTFSNTATQYYVWFTVDGAGANPAPGGTPIKVALESTNNANEVLLRIFSAINGFEQAKVVFPAGSAISAGDYFYLSPAAGNYYVWYNVNGVGTDPAIANRTAIPVEILSADTSTQVANKTGAAINAMYYAVPDFRGYILRGWDDGAGVDLGAATRFSKTFAVYGDVLGTQEIFNVESHVHTTTVIGYSSGVPATTAQLAITPNSTTPTFNFPYTSTAYGGAETVPANKNVLYVIRY